MGCCATKSDLQEPFLDVSRRDLQLSAIHIPSTHKREPSHSERQDVVQAATVVRQCKQFEWQEKYLFGIGSRTDKNHYLVTAKENKGMEFLMSMIRQTHTPCGKSIGPTMRKTLLAFRKNPYIADVVEAGADRKVFYFFLPLYRKGSLRDYMHKASPKNHYAKKYPMDKKIAPLPGKKVSRWGRQILEGLLALEAKGLRHIHLSASNIMVDEDDIVVAGIENIFLQLEPNQSLRGRD
jgi:serine/threonine protein kinase